MNPKTRLHMVPDCEAVLRGALAGERAPDFDKAAVQKCYSKGWIQFDGEDGETLALTANGRAACEAAGIT